MSSSTLSTVQTQVNRYGYPIFIILGSIGNIFVVILFKRQRQNACSLYLISSAIVNTVYLALNGFGQIFPFPYNNGTIGAVLFCKLYTYLVNVLGQAAKTILIFACLDRFLITSDRASFRAFSTPKKAKYLICFSIIFWFLISIHIPILSTIVNGRCVRVGIYSTIYTLYIVLFVGFIPSIILSVFGYLSYRHLRKRHNRVQPIVHDRNDANNAIQRRDRQLLVLVISEVIVYVITTAPFPSILLEMMISQYIISNKSMIYLQIELFTVSISTLVLFINSAAAFYIYFIASKSFRRDFQQLIINSYRRLQGQRLVEVVSRKDTVLRQQDTRV